MGDKEAFRDAWKLLIERKDAAWPAAAKAEAKRVVAKLEAAGKTGQATTLRDAAHQAPTDRRCRPAKCGPASALRGFRGQVRTCACAS